MSDGVISLRPEVELDEFFSFMWGTQTGYVYVPLKDREKEEWQVHFFNWPVDREVIIQHVLDNTNSKECYFGPALYKTPTKPVKENIKGTQVLWTEFDGNAPRNGILGDKIPHPTMRIRSSNEGHEHLYWHLDYFETDVTEIDKINKSIAYTLNADTSAWDATQILRPSPSQNHKRDKVVRTISCSSSLYSKEFFGSLEIPKQLAREEITLEEIPDVTAVIAKYAWDSGEFAFFRKKEMPTGVRSSALMRLAFLCTEMRMSDEEAYSVLRNADDRWGKFRGRQDQTKRLLDLVNRARHKYPLDPGTAIESLPTYTWQELKELEIHVDWLIPGILQRQGIMVIAGRQGVGKTQLGINILRSLATGKKLFDWEFTARRKVAFVWQDERKEEIEISFPKVRLAEAPDPLYVVRHKVGLQFTEAQPTGLIEEAANGQGPDDPESESIFKGPNSF